MKIDTVENGIFNMYNIKLQYKCFKNKYLALGY